MLIGALLGYNYLLLSRAFNLGQAITLGGTTKIVEVTTQGKIVWQLRLKGVAFDREEARGLGFHKADRIGIRG